MDAHLGRGFSQLANACRWERRDRDDHGVDGMLPAHFLQLLECAEHGQTVHDWPVRGVVYEPDRQQSELRLTAQVTGDDATGLSRAHDQTAHAVAAVIAVLMPVLVPVPPVGL